MTPHNAERLTVDVVAGLLGLWFLLMLSYAVACNIAARKSGYRNRVRL